MFMRDNLFVSKLSIELKNYIKNPDKFSLTKTDYINLHEHLIYLMRMMSDQEKSEDCAHLMKQTSEHVYAYIAYWFLVDCVRFKLSQLSGIEAKQEDYIDYHGVQDFLSEQKIIPLTEWLQILLGRHSLSFREMESEISPYFLNTGSNRHA